MLLEWVHFLENSFLEGVTALYNAIGWSGVGLLMAIENTFIPLPSEVIMPFAGWKLVLERGLGISWILWAGFVGEWAVWSAPYWNTTSPATPEGASSYATGSGSC